MRALPQLVIPEPVDGVSKVSPGGVSRVEEQGALVIVDKSLNVDSEEARIARERARKGKAVAEELTSSSPTGMTRASVEVLQQPQEVPSTDDRQVSSVGKFNNNPRPDPLTHDEEKEDKSHLNYLANVNVGDVGIAIDDLVNREVGSDQNLKSIPNGTKINSKIIIDGKADIPEKLEAMEKADIPREMELVLDVVNNGPKRRSTPPDRYDNISSVLKPNFFQTRLKKCIINGRNAERC